MHSRYCLALLLLLSPTAFSASNKSAIPDIPPDAESSFYQNYLSVNKIPRIEALEPIMAIGVRNLDWLKYMNQFRSDTDKISFTSKNTTGGIPIDSPREYSPSIIQSEFDALKSQIPEPLKIVLFSNQGFPKTPPVDLETYILWGRKVDRAYQNAARWNTMEPYLNSLASRRRQDIRGYYFLGKLPNRAEVLKSFSDQAPNVQTVVRDWLIGLCYNSGAGLDSCTTSLNRKIQDKADLNPYYDSYVRYGSTQYNSFFQISSYAARRDTSWVKGSVGDTLLIPFKDPNSSAVKNYLKDNIEDEWHFGTWALNLKFTSESGHAYVEFEPGVTPHVDGLGGDKITMNADQPLTEYDAQWTIRHEFGHVLGFPDCYVEFYDTQRAVIINYQIDIDNLMCSRHGHLSGVHVNELKRLYGKGD